MFLWGYKSSTGQNVRKIKSCTGQKPNLTCSAEEMSDAHRYFKALLVRPIRQNIRQKTPHILSDQRIKVCPTQLY